VNPSGKNPDKVGETGLVVLPEKKKLTPEGARPPQGRTLRRSPPVDAQRRACVTNSAPDPAKLRTVEGVRW